ncbi:MAG TPA: dynamin family protein [Verrucomicrobiae bacterium]
MNDNHRRHLFHTVQHMDELLSEAEQIMATAGSDSPFQKYSQDTTPIQRRVTHDYISRVRQVFRRIIEELTIPPAQPICGALWGARCSVDFAVIDVAEMDARHMLGYGDLSDDEVRTLERIVAELNAELSRVSSFLAAGSAADLQARINRLESTQEEIKLLHELSRIITAHGLIELRQWLQILVERAEARSFEIGVFGRVSSGKSSLLNYLLEQSILPVGVTPVTAVPTRIGYGAETKATIEFIERASLSINLQRLSEYSTEQENPGNAKHVARIWIEVPARCLRDGVVFVDTPGLGSLATSGAEETMAYLPKCDLGIVLLDAGGSLGHEDLVVVEALFRSGAAAMVLVSKADLLDEPDRQKMKEYVREHIVAELGFELPVYLVSVVGGDAQTSDEWFESSLFPIFDTHRERAAATFRRKVGLLKEAVADGLRARLKMTNGEMAHSRPGDLKDAIEALRTANTVLEEAGKEGRKLANTFRSLRPFALQLAAVEIATSWEDKTGDEQTVFSLCLNRFLTQKSGLFFESIASARLKLASILQETEAAFGSRGRLPDELPNASELPSADCAIIADKVQLRRPAFWSVLGKKWMRHFVLTRLSRQAGGLTDEHFDLGSKRLEEWHHHALNELRNAFNARAGIYRAKAEGVELGLLAEYNCGEIEADLGLLQNWPHAVASKDNSRAQSPSQQ